MVDTHMPRNDVLEDARVVWDYHQMHHALRHVDVAVGLGSHDLGVAEFAAELYGRGFFPLVVFTGANSPTTRDRFPSGEAWHYQERAIELGVPPVAILVEPIASNTGQNIDLSRRLLEANGASVNSLMIICKPYMERRAFATCKKVWPGIEVTCASEPLTFDDYLDGIGDAALVIDMLVGDLQRLIEYPDRGFAIRQDVPPIVLESYSRLIRAGYTSRLVKV